METNTGLWKKIVAFTSPAGEGLAEDIKYLTTSIASLFAWLISLQVTAVIVALAGYQIMAAGGVEAVIAQLMAATCANNPNIPCEFNVLLGGVALALIILSSLAVTVNAAIIYISENTDSAEMAIEQQPSSCYNEEMVRLLRTIQDLRTVENLKGLADWKGMALTTARRYCEQFERDGYIKIYSNGKGSPVRIETLK